MTQKKLANLLRIPVVEELASRGPFGMLGLLHKLPEAYHDATIFQVGIYPPEERATLAHEVGHVVLEDLGIPLSSDKYTWEKREKFCNLFAAVILSPDKLLLDKAQELKEDDPFVIFETLYQQTQMPPYMLATRLIDLNILKNTIISVSLQYSEKHFFHYAASYYSRPSSWAYSKDKIFDNNIDYCWRTITLSHEHLKNFFDKYQNWSNKDLEDNRMDDTEAYFLIKRKSNRFSLYSAKINASAISRLPGLKPDFGIVFLEKGKLLGSAIDRKRLNVKYDSTIMENVF